MRLSGNPSPEVRCPRPGLKVPGPKPEWDTTPFPPFCPSTSPTPTHWHAHQKETLREEGVCSAKKAKKRSLGLSMLCWWMWHSMPGGGGGGKDVPTPNKGSKWKENWLPASFYSPSKLPPNCENVWFVSILIKRMAGLCRFAEQAHIWFLNQIQVQKFSSSKSHQAYERDPSLKRYCNFLISTHSCISKPISRFNLP